MHVVDIPISPAFGFLKCSQASLALLLAEEARDVLVFVAASAYLFALIDRGDIVA